MEFSAMPISIDPLDQLRLERGSQHLCKLGPCALTGFLADLCDRIGGMPAALGLLTEYEQRVPAHPRNGLAA
jgi:hypothetical protein